MSELKYIKHFQMAHSKPTKSERKTQLNEYLF